MTVDTNSAIASIQDAIHRLAMDRVGEKDDLEFTMVAINKDLEVALIGCDMGGVGGDAKDALMDGLRAVLKKIGAVAYGFAAESWVATPPPGMKDLQGLRPSQSPNRREAIFTIAFTPGVQGIPSVYEIKRGESGIIISVKKNEEFSTGIGIGGRFAENLLDVPVIH